MAELYDPDLTQWLQLSGQNIVQNRPAEERIPWILFLLDEMNAFLTPAEQAALLVDLQDELQARLSASEA